MNTLTVWRFEAPQTAEDQLAPLRQLVRDGNARADDAALVSWPLGREKPSTRILGSLVGPGSLWGGFWGLLLGLIFLTPLAGPIFGAAAGAVAGSLSDFGVDDDFLKRVRDSVKPGTSAIFVVSSHASSDRLGKALEGIAVDAIRCSLTQEQEKRLRDALGEEPAPETR